MSDLKYDLKLTLDELIALSVAVTFAKLRGDFSPSISSLIQRAQAQLDEVIQVSENLKECS